MIKALALTGPTASGKTSISISLAKRLGCEIISLDSMQIYKGMDIGTAKATEEERAAVAHHMLDFLEPDEAYSAGRYREDALAAAREITGRGRIPLFVGGTGLYMDSLTRIGSDAVPESSLEYRAPLLKLAESESGVRELYERLKAVDPESADMMHMNNVKRVIRALEIYDMTGKPKSYFDKMSRLAAPDVRVGMITLDFHNRDNLYGRIDERVYAMLASGLVDETRALLARGFDRTRTASSAIGYKELFGFIRGEESFDEAVERLKCASRRYAKRQLTWFRHNTDAYRLYLDTEDFIMRGAEDVIAEAECAAREFCDKMQINVCI